MLPQRVFPCRNDDFRQHLPLVVGFGLPLHHADGLFRAMTDAGPQAVAEEIAEQPGLPVDDLQRSFGAARDAQTAPGAFLFVDFYDFSLHMLLLDNGTIP